MSNIYFLTIAREETSVNGTVSIECGDLGSVELLAELFKMFHRRYPEVTFDLYTASADHVKDQMERGTLDIGLFLEHIKESLGC